MKEKISISNIWHYVQGTLRYFLYYSIWRFLIRKHILEQIDYRIAVMDSECFYAGSCKLCGCRTTALQMCDKACGKPCYPEMLDKYSWRVFKIINKINTETIK